MSAAYKLKLGYSYLVKEKRPNKSFKIFSEIIRDFDIRGLCVTRQPPDIVREEHGLKENTSIVWLGKDNDIIPYLSPTNVGKLVYTVREFVKQERGKGIVLLEGLEYLISLNGFNLMLRVVEDINDSIILNKSRLILPVNMGTLSKREMAQLERNMEILAPPPVGAREKEEKLERNLQTFPPIGLIEERFRK